MECPNCGTDNSDGATFCRMCLARFRPEGQPSAEVYEDELAAIRREVNPEAPAVQAVRMRRKVLAVAGGTAIAVAAVVVGAYIPCLPFLWVIGPYVGGMFAGRVAADNGGRYGLVTAIVPATIQGVLPVLGALGVSTMLRSELRRIPGAGGSALPTASIVMPAVLSALMSVAVVLFLGYFGGRAGERLAKGVGFGL